MKANNIKTRYYEKDVHLFKFHFNLSYYGFLYQGSVNRQETIQIIA